MIVNWEQLEKKFTFILKFSEVVGLKKASDTAIGSLIKDLWQLLLCRLKGLRIDF